MIQEIVLRYSNKRRGKKEQKTLAGIVNEMNEESFCRNLSENRINVEKSEQSCGPLMAATLLYFSLFSFIFFISFHFISAFCMCVRSGDLVAIQKHAFPWHHASGVEYFVYVSFQLVFFSFLSFPYSKLHYIYKLNVALFMRLKCLFSLYFIRSCFYFILFFFFLFWKISRYYCFH